MTEERFEELTNLYFDREITIEQLGELKAELACDPDRKAAFLDRMRIEQASRRALYMQTCQDLKKRLASRTPNAQNAPSRSPGMLHWALLAVCLCAVGLQWLRLGSAERLLERIDPPMDSVFAEAVDGLRTLTEADSIEAHAMIMEVISTEIEDINVAIDSVVANCGPLPDIGDLGTIGVNEVQIPHSGGGLIRMIELPSRHIGHPFDGHQYTIYGGGQHGFQYNPTMLAPNHSSSVRFQTVGLETGGNR